ncbi:hypothetical protein LguiB_010782 [Lonicera macranthoides]
MKRAMDLEQETLVKEISQGRELVNQLKNNLDTISSSPQTCELLLQKILSSYEKALSMLNWNALVGEQLPPLKTTLEPPNSHSDGTSQGSEKIDQDSREDQTQKAVFKKRKLSLTKWSEQVNICSGKGKGNPVDDGHSWRKYGQKDILGANFPRAYYRCAHRHTQGCLATKQVQKSNEDPSIIEISYKGRHTCIQSQGKEKPEENKVHFPQPEQVQTQTEEIFFNFGAGLKTEDLAATSEEIFAQFSFPPTPFGSEVVESDFFAESAKENNFMGGGCYSPAFISPATSESNYFSLSPCDMNNLGLTTNLQSSDSDFGEILSAPNSVTNSPIENLDFLLDQVDFDSSLPLDILECFS